MTKKNLVLGMVLVAVAAMGCTIPIGEEQSMSRDTYTGTDMVDNGVDGTTDGNTDQFDQESGKCLYGAIPDCGCRGAMYCKTCDTDADCQGIAWCTGGANAYVATGSCLENHTCEMKGQNCGSPEKCFNGMGCVQ